MSKRQESASGRARSPASEVRDSYEAPVGTNDAVITWRALVAVTCSPAGIEPSRLWFAPGPLRMLIYPLLTLVGTMKHITAATC